MRGFIGMKKFELNNLSKEKIIKLYINAENRISKLEAENRKIMIELTNLKEKYESELEIIKLNNYNKYVKISEKTDKNIINEVEQVLDKESKEKKPRKNKKNNLSMS